MNRPPAPEDGDGLKWWKRAKYRVFTPPKAGSKLGAVIQRRRFFLWWNHYIVANYQAYCAWAVVRATQKLQERVAEYEWSKGEEARRIKEVQEFQVDPGYGRVFYGRRDIERQVEAITPPENVDALVERLKPALSATLKPSGATRNRGKRSKVAGGQSAAFVPEGTDLTLLSRSERFAGKAKDKLVEWSLQGFNRRKPRRGNQQNQNQKGKNN